MNGKQRRPAYSAGAGRTGMTNNGFHSEMTKPMTAKEFTRLSEFIHTQCGIKMPPGKKIMLEARLQKRLKSVGAATFGEYCEYLFNSSNSQEELVHMINAVATNKTDFFREPGHYPILTDTVLPQFLDPASGSGPCFTVWSAGCSSGEEPYTLAMVLSEFALLHPGFRFSIVATDISTKVLEKARLGIYDEERVAPVPLFIKQKYLMKSKDRSKGQVRITPELRALISFERVNLMDEQYRRPELLDVIFCRNVIIYFERANQEKLLGRLCNTLKPGGHLFLGHSETVHGFDLPLQRVTSTVYRKTA
jgi:chemotaxis protein methyltransferase CheR